jgi:hypothetical protein
MLHSNPNATLSPETIAEVRQMFAEFAKERGAHTEHGKLRVLGEFFKTAVELAPPVLELLMPILLAV